MMNMKLIYYIDKKNGYQGNILKCNTKNENRNLGIRNNLFRGIKEEK